jgi:hypothetical protein
MFATLLAIVAAATLAGPFGEAGASAEPDGAYIRVTVRVAVDPSYQADYVVVHLLNPEGQETFSLGPVDGSLHTGEFTILPFNRALVFEVGREDDFVQSQVVSLIDLGLDPELLQTTFRPPDPAGDRNRWGWLAVSTGALAGAALLGWYLLPKPESRRSQVAGPG